MIEQCLRALIPGELPTYDGLKRRTFPDDRHLTGFSKYIDSSGHVVIASKPTSTDSRWLQVFCVRSAIPTCQLN